VRLLGTALSVRWRKLIFYQKIIEGACLPQQ
jgi:hypothetical protein